jgi:hypothetical protein
MAIFLIDEGADFSGTIDGMAYLGYCIKHDLTEVTRLLIRNGADVNGTVDGKSYLAYCVEK